MSEIKKPADLTKYIWGQTGQSVRPSNAKINMGWVAEIPPYQFENWIQNRSDTAIAHIVQHGISAWDTTTEYLKDRSVVLASNGNLYKAVQTHTNRNPVTDGGSNWITLFEDIKESATTTKKGVVELATDAEARGRSSNSVVVTPSGLGSALSVHESASNIHSISAVTGLQAALNSLSSQISQQGSQLSDEIDSIDVSGPLTAHERGTNVHSISAVTGLQAALNSLTSQINDIDIAGAFTERKFPNGYVKLPNGIMIQWGSGDTSTGNLDRVTFPTQFPNACFQVVINEGYVSGWSVNGGVEPTIYGVGSLTRTDFRVSAARIKPTGSSYESGINFKYIAVGN